MILGSIADHLLLLPDRVLSDIYVVDVQDRRAKSFKGEVESRPEQMVVTASEREEAEAIAGAILEPETEMAELAHDLLLQGDGINQWAYQWEDVSGVPLKIMSDRLRLVNRMPVDISLKTTIDPSPGEFSRQFDRFEYECQCALYQRGISHALGGASVPTIVIAVRNEPPHEVWCAQVSDASLRYGKEVISHDLMSLARKLSGEEPWAASWERLPPDGQLPVLEPPRYKRVVLNGVALDRF